MIRWRSTALHGQVEYHRSASAGVHLCPAYIPEDVIAGAAAFHATGITLALGADPAAAIAHATSVARAARVPVSFDLNFRRALWSEAEAAPALTAAIREADVVFAGAEEAAIVTGTAQPLEAALALEALGPRQVVVKLGPAGCLARVDGVTYTVPAPRVTVLDTVGAGHAFVAGYLAELIAGARPERRVATAVAAGAWAVTVAGDWEGMPDRRALGMLETTEPVIR